jgi:hypothetical protein
MILLFVIIVLAILVAGALGDKNSGVGNALGLVLALMALGVLCVVS